MIKPLRSLFLLLALAFSTNTFAQLHMGATTAYNATFVLDKGLSKDPRYNSEYTYQWSPVGFNFGLDIGRKFGLQLESILSNQGQIYKMVNAAQQIAGERKIDLQYINVPMLMKFMSGGSGKARTNFNFGPQLSILNKAVETIQAQAGSYQLPEGVDINDIKTEFPDASLNADGTSYTIPEQPTKELLSKKLDSFKAAEFQIAAAFGLDIDLSKHLYLSSQIRANYSLTDMRNGDVLSALKAGNVGDVFGARANLIVGVQLGLHYYLGTLRSFKE
jgi:hypothetical protein